MIENDMYAVDRYIHLQGNMFNENVQQRWDLGKEKQSENITFGAFWRQRNHRWSPKDEGRRDYS